jgi:hypothetical protein
VPTHIPPDQYLDQQYTADYTLFGGDMMCGIALARALTPPMRNQFIGLAEFVVCQFELNLLNQALYTHGRFLGCRRINQLAPFADTRLCSMGHGMCCHLPYAILKFAQEPFQRMCPRVNLNWDLLTDYTKFFLGDYLQRLGSAESGAVPGEAFWEALRNDYDCFACVPTAQDWETRHVMELLR